MSAEAIPNVPPADELFAIRAQLKALETREAEIKAVLLSDPSSRNGNAYVAEIRSITTNRCDIKELRAAYPQEVDEHTHPVTTMRVELKAIDQETGEILPVKRRSV